MEDKRPWYLEPGRPYRVQRLTDTAADDMTRARILEWFAFKIWVAGEEGTEPDYHSKSYDPLTIEMRSNGSGTAHSYVFDFRDGGRHHDFDSLDQLEDWLTEEAIEAVRRGVRWGEESTLSGEGG